jgi:hypothetical protein
MAVTSGTCHHVVCWQHTEVSNEPIASIIIVDVSVQYGEDSAYKEAKWNLKSTVFQRMNRKQRRKQQGKSWEKYNKIEE